MSQLKGAEDYRILSGSDCITLEGVDDATQFEAVQAACRTIGMKEDTQLQVRAYHIYYAAFFLRECGVVFWCQREFLRDASGSLCGD